MEETVTCYFCLFICTLSRLLISPKQVSNSQKVPYIVIIRQYCAANCRYKRLQPYLATTLKITADLREEWPSQHWWNWYLQGLFSLVTVCTIISANFLRWNHCEFLWSTSPLSVNATIYHHHHHHHCLWVFLRTL